MQQSIPDTTVGGHRHADTKLLLAVAAAGLLLIAIVAVADGQWDVAVRTLGVVGVVAAIVGLYHRRLPKSTAAAYELGLMEGDRDGYARGFKQGRRAPLSIVPHKMDQDACDS